MEAESDPGLTAELARFGRLGRRRIVGYLSVSWVVAILYLGCRDDFADASPAMVQVRGAQYVLCALVFHFGLAALGVLIAAAWKRAWTVAMLAVPVVVVTVLPEVPVARLIGREAPAGKRTISVMSVNVLMVNRDVGPIIEEIRAARPDVLLVQEYAPQWHRALAAEMNGWAYAGVVREDSFGAAIYSRVPFRGTPRVDVQLGTWGLPQMRAVLDVGDRGIAVYNVHLAPPRTTEYVAEHRRQVRDLTAILRAERLPMIVAGDFNFTPRMPQWAPLAALGLADAHQMSYRGRHSTWPVISLMRYVPGIALDHIFVGAGLDVVSSGIGVGTGSDHRPLTAVIAAP